jgi:uncharacterized protein YlxW (UPF0749 family)
MATQPSRTATTHAAILLASIVLGFLLTVQFRTTAARLPTREQSRLATSDAVSRLEEEQRQLKERVSALRDQVADLQHQAAASAPSAPVAADLDQEKMIAGLVALHGPGVSVVLDDSSKPVASSDDANDFIIHDYELRDVVSLLWLAGAEAVAVNTERLVNLSSLYCVGSTILVNDTRQSPPYEVQAIGDAAVLEQALQDPQNLSKLKSRVKTYGIEFRVTQQKDVAVPAYSGNMDIRYARPTFVPQPPADQRMSQSTK